MSFARPWLLLLLLLIPVVWSAGELLRRRIRGGLRVSPPPAAAVPATWRTRAYRAVPIVRAIALGLLVIALAGPRFGRARVKSYSEGIDIVLALDISGSMQALDFAPGNRLEAAKEVAHAFVQSRTADRIGLVVFASNSYTQCPLTTDYAMLEQLIDEIQIGDIKDGTAVGMAIGNALNRLRDVPGRSRVVILLTDGMNNTGVLDPLTAAGLARDMGVRIYTVGAGTKGRVPFPVDDPLFGRTVRQVEVDLDEATLRAIADSTGGQYFRATDRASLLSVYQTIDKLEKTRVEVEEYVEYHDIGARFLWPAMVLVVLELVAGSLWLRRLP